MDFFEHQDRALRKSKRLVGYFLLAVVLIVLSVYAAALLIFSFTLTTGSALQWWWNPAVFLWVLIPTLAVIAGGSFYKIASLSRGGETVARRLGGRPVEPNSADLNERKLLNVVEEMALASGIPVPSVFVLEQDQGINAFAAGYTPGDAVIGVTRGTMVLLNRDELQGVIAHEFSHVLNGDMRLNIRLMGILHGILVIALVGYALMRSTRRSGRRKKGGGQIAIFGVALYAIGYIGVFFGKLIKSAVSRQREYLADASAVQFTRNPAGIAGALKKIGGLIYSSGIKSPNAEEASHLFFANALIRPSKHDGSARHRAARGRSAIGFLATHPPLEDRIRRIDPAFDGELPLVKFPEPSEPSPPEVEKGMAPEIPAASRQIALTPTAAIERIGALTPALLAYASGLLSELPGSLRASAHEPAAARAVILSLLLSRNSETRQKQFQLLEGSGEKGLTREVLDRSTEIDRSPPRTRLPLVDLCVPALRSLSEPQYRRFMDLVEGLIEADSEVELFEYALFHLLRRHLAPHFRKISPPVVRYRTPSALQNEISFLFSLLASLGHEPERAGPAFQAAMEELEDSAGTFPFQESLAWDSKGISVCLDKLTLASPELKRRLLKACAACVSQDNRITLEEGELLRAIADALDCPMPPFE